MIVIGRVRIEIQRLVFEPLEQRFDIALHVEEREGARCQVRRERERGPGGAYAELVALLGTRAGHFEYVALFE